MEVINEHTKEELDIMVLEGKLRIADVPLELRTSDVGFYIYAVRYARNTELAFTELKVVEHLLMHDIMKTNNSCLNTIYNSYFGNQKACLKYVQATGGKSSNHG